MWVNLHLEQLLICAFPFNKDNLEETCQQKLSVVIFSFQNVWSFRSWCLGAEARAPVRQQHWILLAATLIKIKRLHSDCHHIPLNQNDKKSIKGGDIYFFGYLDEICVSSLTLSQVDWRRRCTFEAVSHSQAVSLTFHCSHVHVSYTEVITEKF